MYENLTNILKTMGYDNNMVLADPIPWGDVEVAMPSEWNLPTFDHLVGMLNEQERENLACGAEEDQEVVIDALKEHWGGGPYNAVKVDHLSQFLNDAFDSITLTHLIYPSRVYHGR